MTNPPEVPNPQLPTSATHKGYAFVKDGVVTTTHYWDLTTDTTPLDDSPQIIPIPQEQVDSVLVGWKYINGEFIQ